MSAVKENFIPKEATQQIEFFKKYPEYDGRGIKIAIIDTDIVDTNLPGLQKTSNGLPKIIDCCGKSGITVDTSVIVETNGKKFINALSGRKIKIPSKWINPSNKWHIGSISFDELFDIKIADTNTTKFKKVLDFEKIRMDWLKDKNFDCIVWFDGKKWRACFPSTFSKNFENVKVLKNFDDSYDVVHLNENSMYCINISDDGNAVKLLPPLHAHASQVSLVAAGYFLENSESSGVAPGAQIVSLDWRRIKDALLKCIELKVDIVNLSVFYSLPTYMAIKDTIKKMVEEHGIIVTQIAGNWGPLFSSMIERFSLISEYVFFIAAITTSDVKQKFGYTKPVNSVHYSSAKGPLLSSGARGVDFVAPGEAITDLPKWYRCKNKWCHGTSFAAPNAAGLIACLLSALKANSILYSPKMIKMALAKTAFFPEGSNKLEVGNGIIQILSAFEFIKNFQNILPLKFLITPISIDDGPEKKGIIFYRSKNISTAEYRYYVNIDPEFDTKWILKSSSDYPQNYIDYQKTDNFFIVKINANSLEEGSINYSEVYGFDSLNPSIGPLFYLPITVICPADSFINRNIILTNTPSHFFFKCPSESRQCCISIISLQNSEANKIIVEYLQKKSWLNEFQGKRVLEFTEKINIRSISFEVEENVKYFEICMYHKNSSALNFKVNVSFSKVTI